MLRPETFYIDSKKMADFLAASVSLDSKDKSARPFDVSVSEKRNHEAFLHLWEIHEKDRKKRNDSKNFNPSLDSKNYQANQNKLFNDDFIKNFKPSEGTIALRKYQLLKLISNMIVTIELCDRLDKQAELYGDHKKQGIYKITLPSFSIPSRLKESPDDKGLEDIIKQYETKFENYKKQKDSEEKKLATAESKIESYRQEVVALQKRLVKFKENPVSKETKEDLITQLVRLEPLIQNEEKTIEDTKKELDSIKQATTNIQQKAHQLEDLITSSNVSLATKLAEIQKLERELLFLKEIQVYLNSQLLKPDAIDVLIEDQFKGFNKTTWRDYKKILIKIHADFSSLPKTFIIENLETIRKNITSLSDDFQNFQKRLKPLLPAIVKPPILDSKHSNNIPKRRTQLGTSVPLMREDIHLRLPSDAKNNGPDTLQLEKLSKTVQTLLAEIRVIEIKEPPRLITTPVEVNPVSPTTSTPVMDSKTDSRSESHPVASDSKLIPKLDGSVLPSSLPPVEASVTVGIAGRSVNPSGISSALAGISEIKADPRSPLINISERDKTLKSDSKKSLTASAPGVMGSSSAVVLQPPIVEVKKPGFFSNLWSGIKSAFNAFDKWTDDHPYIWGFMKYILIPAGIAAAVIFTGGLAAIPTALGFAGAKAAGCFTAAAIGKTAAIQFGASMGALELPLVCTEARRCFKKPNQADGYVILPDSSPNIKAKPIAGLSTAGISRTAHMPIPQPSPMHPTQPVITVGSLVSGAPQSYPTPKPHYAFQGKPTPLPTNRSLKFGSVPN